MSEEEESPSRRPDPDSDPELEAADWLIRLHETGLRNKAQLQSEFEQWRDADVSHADAFQKIARTWEAIGAHAETPEVVALRREAREERKRRLDQKLRKKRTWWTAIGVVDALAVAAVLAYVFLSPPSAQLITTGIGQTKVDTLGDGTRVEIDADSVVSVDFTRSTRRVRLLKGQIYLQVAKDRSRPFVVECNHRSVVATGTAFDVESLPGGLHVTLVEGHVLVRSGVSPVIARLEPGDSLVSLTGIPDRLLHHSNLLALLAWRTGHLMFDDVPLGDAVATMRHYVHQQVVVDPSVASFRISGVFAAGDMQGLLEAVEAYYPVAERPESAGGVRLTRRS